MGWIVLGEKGGNIQLVSKSEVDGLLPKGSYLTVEDKKSKFILRVSGSSQSEPYSPSPMIIDMDLSSLVPDQRCQNIINAYRVKDLNEREDGLIDYIKPQSLARRSTQEEIDLALGDINEGPDVFLATVHSGKNQILIDENSDYIKVKLPKDMFFHQTLVCGKTGSGKTVSIKYLSQYFVEDLNGAVLAINVKDVDLLKMNESSKSTSPQVLKEWKSLKKEPHGISNFMIYYPANTFISPTKGVNPINCQKITLDVKEIDPESLTGLLQGISDIGAQSLPNIFRYWQDQQVRKNNLDDFTFWNFVDYFQKGIYSDCTFDTLTENGHKSEIKLHRGTFDNVLRNLNLASSFFDNSDAISLSEDDILSRGKMSVIDVAGKNGIQFGSIILRHLLSKIVAAKSEKRSTVPILIIIDEVHQFYNTNASNQALGDLDTICRTGRSQEIGVIFSSQNPTDIPKGLSSVINSTIFFKSDPKVAKSFDVSITAEEMESLKRGFASASIHDLAQAKILKFPLSYAGVFEES